MLVVSLDIHSYSGYSIGAEHYYGMLEYMQDGEMVREELQYELSSAQAVVLNIKERGNHYSAGDMCGRYNREEECIEHGISLAKERLGDDIVVRLNCFTSAQPERTVYAPNGILDELSPIEDEWFAVWDSSNDPWGHHEEALDEIDARWEAVNKKYGITKR